MASRREPILVRLLAIGETLFPARAWRNRNDISGNVAPSFNLRDGSEVTDEGKGEKPRRGQVSSMLECAVMSPTLQVMVSTRRENIGTSLNTYRDQLIIAILGDAELKSLCGSSYGLIRYSGCDVEVDSGEGSEGRIDVNFELRYPVIVSEL